MGNKLFSLLLGVTLVFIPPTHTEVYICTGGYSKRYHRTERCRGLGNCRGTVKKVTLEMAEDMRRTPCRICYR